MASRMFCAAWLWSASLLLFVLDAASAQTPYQPIPRWGQASALLYQNLYVYGGRTDPQHQFTYDSAPNTNDLLSLNLSIPFSLSDPPWSYVSGSNDTSSSQGPKVAFHTLTPYTANDLLLFGGDAGFTAPSSTSADSAWLLNVLHRQDPLWTQEVQGWASQPIRRIYHNAPAASGAVFILGGEKDDGSQLGFPDSSLFNAVGNDGSPSFTPLDAQTNAPVSLFGHQAILMPGGLLLVFGGFTVTSNAPSPLSKIYALDTTSSSLSWSILNATGSVPTSRRGFAACILNNGKILIHGGADAVLQNVFSDAALLDTTQSPMVWSAVDNLTETLGPRFGHFAVNVAGQIFFGFGWAGSVPASADLVLYDPDSGSFPTSFSPSSNPMPVTTVPLSPTAPGGTYPAPTATGGSATTGGSGGGNSPSNPKGTNPTSHDDTEKKSVVGAVVGSVLGFMALVALVGTGSYYALRRREKRAWMGVDASLKKDVEGRWHLFRDESMDEQGNPQMAGTWWNGPPKHGWGVLGAGMARLGFLGHDNFARRRFDMLADEDARQYGVEDLDDEAEWGQRPRARRGASEHTTRSTGARSFGASSDSKATRPWSQMVNNSVVSFKGMASALGIGSSATGAAAAREGRGQDVNPPAWWEKESLPLDPHSEASDDHAWGPAAAGPSRATAMRPRGGEYPSSSKASNPYVDPFDDEDDDLLDARPALGFSEMHDEGAVSTLAGSSSGHGASSSRSSLPRSTAVGALSRIVTPATLSSDPHDTLSLVSSRSTDKTQSTEGSGSTGTSLAQGTLQSSHSHSNRLSSPSPVSPRTTSIIGVPTSYNAPVRRSDSWWSRFSRTSFRDRHGSDASVRHSGNLTEFRDPNPAPKLGAIKESSISASPNDQSPNTPSQAAKVQRANSGYAVSTRSSVKTEKTADSEFIERMGGRLQVTQRATSLNSSRHESEPSSTVDDSHEGHGTGDQASQASSTRAGESFVESPIDGFSPTASSAPQPSSVQHLLTPSDPLSSHRQLTGPRPLISQESTSSKGSSVASRIHAYEHRLSLDMTQHDGPRSPPPDVKVRAEERNRRGGVAYGLAPQLPLYVANPDRRQRSGDSTEETP